MDLFDLVFPKWCMGCKRLGSYFCTSCRQKIRYREYVCSECDRPAIDGLTHPGCRRRYGLDGLITVFQYRGLIKKAIKQLKYRFVYDCAQQLIDLVPEKVWQRSVFPASAVLYPIPLHVERLKWRGFNQAEKLGLFVGKKLHIPVTDGLLIRSHKRTPQADILHREERIKNARGLFTPSSKKPPAHIVLFDDVWTTGSTMKEACQVLKRQGVEQVWGMTLAR